MFPRSVNSAGFGTAYAAMDGEFYTARVNSLPPIGGCSAPSSSFEEILTPTGVAVNFSHLLLFMQPPLVKGGLPSQISHLLLRSNLQPLNCFGYSHFSFLFPYDQPPPMPCLAWCWLDVLESCCGWEAVCAISGNASSATLFRDFFWTLFGHVPDKFGGQKLSFSKKFWGCLGYHLASSEVSETRSKKLFKNIFSKQNKSCADVFLYILAPELNSDLFSRAVLGIFRFFHIFNFFPPCRRLYTLFGPSYSGPPGMYYPSI